MKFFSGLKTVIVACLATLSVSLSVAPAQAQFGPHEISHSTDIWYSQQNGQMYGSGNAHAENAVATQLSSSVHYNLNMDTQMASIQVSVYVSGYWGDPTANNPYYDLLQYRRLSTRSSFRETAVTFDGEWYEFNDVIDIYISGFAQLDRDDEHSYMYGYNGMISTGTGAWITSAYSSVQIYDVDHPTWQPDWEINFTTNWEQGFHRVPTPGSLALLGLGGLAVARRRRD